MTKVSFTPGSIDVRVVLARVFGCVLGTKDVDVRLNNKIFARNLKSFHCAGGLLGLVCGAVMCMWMRASRKREAVRGAMTSMFSSIVHGTSHTVQH